MIITYNSFVLTTVMLSHFHSQLNFVFQETRPEPVPATGGATAVAAAETVAPTQTNEHHEATATNSTDETVATPAAPIQKNN